MRNAIRKIFIFFVFCLGFLHADPIRMTVFVHGTVMPRVSFTAFAYWFKGILKGGKQRNRKIGLYQEYMEQVKRTSIHRNQPINRLGLVPVNVDADLPKRDFGYIGMQTARFIKRVHRELHPDCKDECLFYTFGWSGRLSQQARYLAAEELYDAVLAEMKRVSTEKKKPVELHVMAHSHGCNVVLNLDFVEKKKKRKLRIGRVVFFGAPVHEDTETCVKSDIFGKIYHIYSHGDHVQRLDFVSTKERFTRREFGNGTRKVALPKKLHQIEVQLGRCKPYHYELWLWSTNRFPYFYYRRRVPLFPLPLSVFTPIILYLADQVEKKADSSVLSHLRFNKKTSTFALSNGADTFSHTLSLTTFQEAAYKVL